MRLCLAFLLTIVLCACQPMLLPAPTPEPVDEIPSPFVPDAYADIEISHAENDAVLDLVAMLSPPNMPWTSMGFESRNEQSEIWLRESEYQTTPDKYAVFLGLPPTVAWVHEELSKELERFQDPENMSGVIAIDLFAIPFLIVGQDLVDEPDDRYDQFFSRPSQWLDDPDYIRRLELIDASLMQAGDLERPIVIALSDCTTLSRRTLAAECPTCEDLDQTAYAICLY